MCAHGSKYFAFLTPKLTLNENSERNSLFTEVTDITQGHSKASDGDSLLHRRSVQLITAQDTRCHSSVLSRLWYWEPWHYILVSDLSDSGQGEWDMLTEVGSGDNESEAGTVQRKLSAQACHGFLGAGIYPARRYGSLASLPPRPFLSHLLLGSLSWFLCHCSDAKIIGQKQLTGDSFRLTVLEGYST